MNFPFVISRRDAETRSPLGKLYRAETQRRGDAVAFTIKLRLRDAEGSNILRG